MNLLLKKTFSILFIVLILSGCISAQKRRQTFIDSNPNISQDHKNAILNGDILKGMNKDEVIASLGRPWEKTISDSAVFVKTEIWSYGECLTRCDEIVFDANGAVIDYDIYRNQE